MSRKHAKTFAWLAWQSRIGPDPSVSAVGLTESSKMAGQVRVLQLEAGQELETKLFRIEKGEVLVLYKSLMPGSVSKLFENLYLYFRVGWQQVYVGAKLTFLTSWFLSFWCFLRKTGPKNCICTICSTFVLYFHNRNFLLFIKGENLKIYYCDQSSRWNFHIKGYVTPW